MVIRCRTCARGHSEGPCRSSPQEGSCYCQQCHTHAIMGMARQALDSNSIAKIRSALEGVYALQFQTATQRQRKAARQPAILYCAACGSPVPVRRRPPLGQAVYCRNTSSCRVRAFRKRQRAAPSPVTETTSQVPGIPARSAPEPALQPLGPAELWLAMRAG